MECDIKKKGNNDWSVTFYYAVCNIRLLCRLTFTKMLIFGCDTVCVLAYLRHMYILRHRYIYKIYFKNNDKKNIQVSDIDPRQQNMQN